MYRDKRSLLNFDRCIKKLGICDNTIRNVCVGIFKSAYSKVHRKNLSFDYIETERKKYMPVICITTNERFKTTQEASDHYNISLHNIIRNCEYIGKSAGKHPVTNEKMIWKYQLDYEIENQLCLHK